MAKWPYSLAVHEPKLVPMKGRASLVALCVPIAAHIILSQHNI